MKTIPAALIAVGLFAVAASVLFTAERYALIQSDGIAWRMDTRTGELCTYLPFGRGYTTVNRVGGVMPLACLSDWSKPEAASAGRLVPVPEEPPKPRLFPVPPAGEESGLGEEPP